MAKVLLNLQDKLTVFVITVGNPNFEDCLKALQNQTCKFKLEIIKNVYPISVAFQRMIDNCKTEYYIQVDEDMILFPYAIEKMYLTIENGNPFNYKSCDSEFISRKKLNFVSFALKDPHLDMYISGIKIYRHSIFKQYPYDLKLFSCEFEQLQRVNMKHGGVLILELNEQNCMGLHSPKWNEYFIFQRYKNLMEKHLLYSWMGWVQELPIKFVYKFLREPTRINLFALFGLIAGILSDKSKLKGERDIRTYARKEFSNIIKFFEKYKR